jgi:intracellular multiplication protein IcmE
MSQDQQFDVNSESADKKARAATSSEIRKKNLLSVFGSGPGRLAIIIGGFAAVSFSVLAYKGLSQEAAPSAAPKSDPGGRVPVVTKSKLREYSPQEAQYRAAAAISEANAAAENGGSYQAEMTGNIKPLPPRNNDGKAQPDLPMGITSYRGANSDPQDRYRHPSTSDTSSPPAPPRNSTEIASTANTPSTPEPSAEEKAAAAAEERQYQDSVKTQVKMRMQLEDRTLQRIDELMSDKGLGRKNGFTTVAYYTPKPGGNGNATGQTGNGNNQKQGKTSLVFKAGNVIYATLDAEVNTDDGGAVFATVRGGKWNGSKLIGKIEQGNDNIRLVFTTLTTQDDQRPSIPINAIAIRESDAKQGVAEYKDRHLIERYSSLVVASILSGIGKAASVSTGTTTTLPNGTTTTTQDAMTDRRMAQIAIGEIGTNAGAEIRQGFSRPTTYITPANQGIGVIFLADVADNEPK